MFDIKNNNEFYNLRSKSKEMFKLINVWTGQKQMSLSIHGVKIWSSIGEDVKRCKTIHSFKSNGQTLLLSQYSKIPVFCCHFNVPVLSFCLNSF